MEAGSSTSTRRGRGRGGSRKNRDTPKEGAGTCAHGCRDQCVYCWAKSEGLPSVDAFVIRDTPKAGGICTHGNIHDQCIDCLFIEYHPLGYTYDMERDASMEGGGSSSLGPPPPTSHGKETIPDRYLKYTSQTTCIPLPHWFAEGVYLLTFDGYHSSKRRNEGYGAILRRDNGTHVAALAGGSNYWISAYFHTLEGLLSGLDLVISRDIKAVFCVCNAQRVYETLNDCFLNIEEGECPSHPDEPLDLVCRPCVEYRLTEDEPLDLIYNMLRKIVQKGKQYIRHDEELVGAHPKEWNQPADYLAKLESRPGKEKVLVPEQFPDVLRALVNRHGGRNPFWYR